MRLQSDRVGRSVDGSVWHNNELIEPNGQCRTSMSTLNLLRVTDFSDWYLMTLKKRQRMYANVARCRKQPPQPTMFSCDFSLRATLFVFFFFSVALLRLYMGASVWTSFLVTTHFAFFPIISPFLLCCFSKLFIPSDIYMIYEIGRGWARMQNILISADLDVNTI